MRDDPNHERAIQAAFDGGVKVPEGWKLVPIEPTPEMRDAYRRALKRFIDTLSPDEKVRRIRKDNEGRGYHVQERQKLLLRWHAMLAAAPMPTE